MKHALTLAILIGCAACAEDHGHPLPDVPAVGPVTQLNPDRWDANSNDILKPVAVPVSTGRGIR